MKSHSFVKFFVKIEIYFISTSEQLNSSKFQWRGSAGFSV